MRSATCGEDLIDSRFFKAIQQLPYRLIDAGDTRNGSGPRNDAHLIGRVAPVMGLPQRIATPPATDILVDDGNEVDRLTRGLALFDEERHICRMQEHRAGIGVAGQQCRDRTFGIFEQSLGLGGEDCRNRAIVHSIQACLGALQHGREALPPGDVQPGRAGPLGVGGAIPLTDCQFDVSAQPLQVGHIGNIAEIGLRGQRHRGDDLVAARCHRLGITGDIIEQSATARCGVINLVNVGAELAAPRCHTAGCFSGTHPVLGADRIDEQLLDRLRRGGLQAGHCGGTGQNAVHRHHGVSVGL